MSDKDLKEILKRLDTLEKKWPENPLLPQLKEAESSFRSLFN